MAQGDIETFYEDNVWKSRREGSAEVFGAGDSKEDAVAKGRDAAMQEGVEHIIRNQNGQIGERNDYRVNRGSKGMGVTD